MFAYLANKLLTLTRTGRVKELLPNIITVNLPTQRKNEFAFYSTLSETLANMINIEIFASPLSARYFRFIFIFCFI